MCDIVAPEIYGSGNKQLLHIFSLPMDKNFNFPISINVQDPHYIQVLRSYVSSIKISILDIYDNPIQLADHRCPIIVVLNFRKY